MMNLAVDAPLGAASFGSLYSPISLPEVPSARDALATSASATASDAPWLFSKAQLFLQELAEDVSMGNDHSVIKPPLLLKTIKTCGLGIRIPP